MDEIEISQLGVFAVLAAFITLTALCTLADVPLPQMATLLQGATRQFSKEHQPQLLLFVGHFIIIWFGKFVTYLWDGYNVILMYTGVMKGAILALS